ncbi:MAG: hypothetical protein NTW10_09585 [Bacteroidetes bacterium]|nr:hypothetical protein [Bacteroidota bacterium]
MKRLLMILFFMSSLSALFAQNSSDALRYSRILYSGSARFQGLGGAFGAVGAEFSSLATNPAGLGLYNSSEFSLGPSFRLEYSNADYNTEVNRDNKFSVGMGNLGMVFHLPGNGKNSGGFKSFNIGFGMNRQNDFNSRVFIEGVNNKNSLLTEYADILNNTPGGMTPQMINDQYPFDIAPAYNANLLYLSDSANLIYKNDAPNGGVIQSKSINTRGSINEFNFSFGANFNDRLYFGATIGVPLLNYYEFSHYTETNNDTAKVHYFRSMTYDQELQTRGTGINFKVGLIYRPANWVRIGAAVHTPTYYGNMRDSWNSSMVGEFDDGTYTSSSPLGSFDYQLTTPFRAIGSLAFIIGNFGLISGEYEYVNYNQARLYSSSSSFSDVNKEIQNKYKSPMNLRVGTEWRIRSFMIRGGFGYYGSPYQSSINTGEMYTGSFGLGYRVKHFFCDLSYFWTQTKENYYLYDPTMVNASLNRYTTSTVTTTIGFRF